MNRNRLITILLLLAPSLGVTGAWALAQQPVSQSKEANGSAISRDESPLSKLPARPRSNRRSFFNLMPENRKPNLVGSAFSITPATAPAPPVTGIGTLGMLTKWGGFTNSNSAVVDSNIYEDKFGMVGIGTVSPTSKLTVAGLIESIGTNGGVKFPDGTVQTTAGISFVTHDDSLMGDGRSATPLGIALGGVKTFHLSSGVVTAPKIANGTVVRSLNGLFDNISLAAGSNITITPSGSTLTISSPNSLSSVAHDSTLTGNGTAGSPLGVADGGIGTGQIANQAVTLSKIALNQVVTKLNNLTESVTLAAGANITITPSGNTLTIAGAGGSSSAFHLYVLGPIGPLNNPGLDVISKTVPSGDYLVFIRLRLVNEDDDEQPAECSLRNSGVFVDKDLADIPRGFKSATLVIQGEISSPSTTTITIHCSGFNVRAQEIVFTALKVGSIQ